MTYAYITPLTAEVGLVIGIFDNEFTIDENLLWYYYYRYYILPEVKL
jgi:hypothetical protein